MKFVILLTTLLAVALAVHSPKDNKDILSEHDNVGMSIYNWAVETSDGKYATEQGELKNPGTEQEFMAVHGDYSFVGNDGDVYKVSYVADENGYQLMGDHFPLDEAHSRPLWKALMNKL